MLKNAFKNLFIPGENNNFRARALHHDFLTSYLVIALLFFISVKSFSSFRNNVLGFATDITIQKLYQFTNVDREKNGLSDLSYNERLSQAAYKKATDMFTKNYWAHFAPDGKTPWDFIYEAGYQYEYAGENLAKNFLFSQNVVDAWMNSPSHRENLLRKEYTEVGFAIVNGVLNGEETTLVVQMFGKPLNNGLALTKKPVVTPSSQTINLAGVESQKNIINLPKFSFNMFWVFSIFLIIVFATDFYFGIRLNLIRFHGKNMIHIIFLLFVSLSVLLFFTRGVIL